MADPLSVTASLISMATFACQIAQSLGKTIGDIQDAPEVIAGVSVDVRNVLTFLNDLCTRPEVQARLERNELESSEGCQSVAEALRSTVQSCADDCAGLQKDITQWTRHSRDGKMARRDRMYIALFREDRIERFRQRINQSGASVSLALASVGFETNEMVRRMYDSTFAKQEEVASRNRDLERSIEQVQAQIEEVGLREANTGDRSARDRGDMEDTDGDITALREELRLLKAQIESSREIIESSRGMQDIREVSMDRNSRVTVGFINTDDQDVRVNQRISQVKATDGSRGIVGHAKNVNMDSFWG